MGIKTVAVYSEADANARHVRLADEAVLIGPAAARRAIWSSTRSSPPPRTGPGHPPGYGFLRERDFCHACERAGIVFIGPPVSAIRAMGSEVRAKKLMEAAGVPLVPATTATTRTRPGCTQADAIGYPVLIKASRRRRQGHAPGRQVEDFIDAGLLQARGDLQLRRRPRAGREVHKPRHIEIQVFGDTTATWSTCSSATARCSAATRRCSKSARARHDAERRAAMGKAAVDAAKAVGYVGAGTVEFIANQDGSFYFMEMNTRLQVEHPVTEMITGLDLVSGSCASPPARSCRWRRSSCASAATRWSAHLRRRPGQGFLPSTGHAWCIWRRRPRACTCASTPASRRRRDQPALRPDDRQADRLGHQPRPRASPACCRRWPIPGGGRGQQHRVPVAPHGLSGLRRRRPRHRAHRAREGLSCFPSRRGRAGRVLQIAALAELLRRRLRRPPRGARRRSGPRPGMPATAGA